MAGRSDPLPSDVELASSLNQSSENLQDFQPNNVFMTFRLTIKNRTVSKFEAKIRLRLESKSTQEAAGWLNRGKGEISRVDAHSGEIRQWSSHFLLPDGQLYSSSSRSTADGG